jgi:SAM-dependent methyltransferase
MASERLWNANIHYHSLLVKAIPKDSVRVLDVGCGDGILAADLIRAGVQRVVAVDIDAGVLARAKARHPHLAIEWIQSDIFGLPVPANHSFDALVSVATLHHIDAVAGLRRFAQLVRPGGVVGVVGLAANNWWDWPLAAASLCAQTVMHSIRGNWEHSAPMIWPPPATYGEMKRIALQVLPGVRYRRHLYGRYSLLWTKPAALI